MVIIDLLESTEHTGAEKESCPAAFTLFFPGLHGQIHLQNEPDRAKTIINLILKEIKKLQKNIIYPVCTLVKSALLGHLLSYLVSSSEL